MGKGTKVGEVENRSNAFTVDKTGDVMAAGGITATGLITANDGIDATTIEATGLITASGGIDATTIEATGLITANYGLNLHEETEQSGVLLNMYSNIDGGYRSGLVGYGGSDAGERVQSGLQVNNLKGQVLVQSTKRAGGTGSDDVVTLACSGANSEGSILLRAGPGTGLADPARGVINLNNMAGDDTRVTNMAAGENMTDGANVGQFIAGGAVNVITSGGGMDFTLTGDQMLDGVFWAPDAMEYNRVISFPRAM